jgi:hypothetical protein
MTLTFDFIRKARKDVSFRNKIEDALRSGKDCQLCTDILRMSFNSQKRTMIVRRLSENSPFHWKVFPVEITYDAVHCMINDDFDNISDGEIKYIE